HRPADSPRQVVHRRLIGAVHPLQGGGIAGPGPGEDDFRVSQHVGVVHDAGKDAGGRVTVAGGAPKSTPGLGAYISPSGPMSLFKSFHDSRLGDRYAPWPGAARVESA